LQLSPGLAAAYYNRGLAEEKLGKTELAVADHRKARSLGYVPDKTKTASEEKEHKEQKH
jgi:hypothetical protein